MSETELRTELERASAHLRPHADAQTVWERGIRARRRNRALVVGGAVAAAAVIAIGGVTVQATDSTAPDPRPPATNPTPDNSGVERGRIPYLTESQVQPKFDPAEVETLPWDEASGVRSWNPGDPVPLSDDPVEHAAVAVQSDYDEPDGIFVLGDDGRWRELDLTGIELPDSYEYTFGISLRSLSPDGTRLAIGQPDGVLLVDLRTGERSRYPVTGLGPRWQGREVAWSADTTTVYVDSTAPAPGVAIDLASGKTRPVPFNVGNSAYLDDGQVVEDFFSMRHGSQIRAYDASGELVFRAPNSTVLDALEYVVGRGDRWAAQRINAGWEAADPRHPDAPASGVLVLSPPARPEAFLPVKGYGLNGGDGSVLGWRGDDTVLFQVGLWSASEDVVAWNVETGRLTRIAEYDNNRIVSVAADHLPTR